MIDSDRKLADFLPRLESARWIAMDTEADSLHAYPEKLCLIQISLEGEDALVDPLAGVNLKPLLDILHRHELIMHGADYDLRLLRKSLHFVPTRLFDTMLASRLLGLRHFGLDALAQKFLGVKLEKGSQKANWARRPLTEQMEQYARNDTRYLHPLAELLRAALRKEGRLDWHRETCARLLADSVQPDQPDPETIWRVKGSHSLKPAALAVLRQLWHWREQEAVRLNRPPFFVLSPNTLVQVSSAAAEHGELDGLLPARWSQPRREAIKKAIAEGLHAEKPPRVLRAPHYRQSPAERRRMLEMLRRRDRQAAELGLDPSFIASRSMLVQLARDWDAHAAELTPWQRRMLLPEAPAPAGARDREPTGRHAPAHPSHPHPPHADKS